MKTHDFKVSVNDYRCILAGIINIFAHENNDEFCICDKLRFKEFNGSIYTGRVCECLITNVERGKHVADGYCIISFQLFFPETEPRFPMSAYMELFQLYAEARTELDVLKENQLI